MTENDIDKLDLDISEIAARDGAAAGDKYLTPAMPERHAWDDLFTELRDGVGQ